MAPKNHKKGKKPGDDKNIEDNKDMEMELVKSSKDQVPDQPEEIEAASAPQATVNTTESKKKSLEVREVFVLCIRCCQGNLVERS